jgi:hypothetical protein
LIGGPNQSHKVNFKDLFLLLLTEPLAASLRRSNQGERVSNKNLSAFIVNIFFEDFRNFFRSSFDTQRPGKEPQFSPRLSLPLPLVLRTAVHRREAEPDKCCESFKTFFQESYK